MTPVDSVYADLGDAAKALLGSGQISMAVTLEENLGKTLLLSAASYFEWRLCRQVQEFVDEVTNNNSLVTSLVVSKAINRQFHTWFDWDQGNASRFFSLFGQGFKEHMNGRIKSDNDLAAGIKAFMKIGSTRNQLVHSDYATFKIDSTPSEIYSLYKSAIVFVECVSFELRECSKNVAK